MKLEDAIEILDTRKAPPLMHPESRYSDAIKLGIEALKQIKVDRIAWRGIDRRLLPGETK